MPVHVPGIFSSEEEILVVLQLQTWLCCISWCGAVCVVIVYTTQYSDIHKHNTKEKQDLYVQLCNTARCLKNVINMGIKINNNLPFELKE
jgi:hypothetical protein